MKEKIKFSNLNWYYNDENEISVFVDKDFKFFLKNVDRSDVDGIKIRVYRELEAKGYDVDNFINSKIDEIKQNFALLPSNVSEKWKMCDEFRRENLKHAIFAFAKGREYEYGKTVTLDTAGKVADDYMNNILFKKNEWENIDNSIRTVVDREIITSSKFKIGDTVKVIDEERVYHRYNMWVEGLDYDEKYRFVPFASPLDEDIPFFKVVAKAKHSKYNPSVLYFIKGGSGKCYIIGEDGLEKWDETDETKSDNINK